MIKHYKWFYTEYNGEKFKIKFTDRGVSYATIRIFKLWKFGIYFPFIWDAREKDILSCTIRRETYYSQNDVKYYLKSIFKRIANPILILTHINLTE